GAGRSGEVCRKTLARDVDTSGGVQSDTKGPVVTAAAQVSGEDQGRAGRVQFCNEGIWWSGIRTLIGTLGRKVDGESEAGDVGVSRTVHLNSLTDVSVAAAQVCGVKQ